MEIIRSAGLWRKAVLAVLLSVLFFSAGFAFPPADSVAVLKEVEVRRRVAPSGVSVDSAGVLVVNARDVRRGMRVLGEADAIRVVSMLPGHNTNSDYGAGVSIGGASYANTGYELDGVSVFFPFHFGGIFSSFNSAHISSAAIVAPGARLSSAYRLGSTVSARTSDFVPSRLIGSFNVGLLASSLSLGVPVSEASSFRASARVSYLNALYGSLIKVDGSPASYGFEDVNLVGLHKFDDRNSLKVSFLANSDRLCYGDGSFSADMALDWRNIAGGAVFSHHGECSVDASLSFSSLSSELSFDMSQFGVSVSSSVGLGALAADVTLPDGLSEFGFLCEYGRYLPQRVDASGLVSADASGNLSHAWMVSAGAARRFRLPHALMLRVGLRGAVNFAEGYTNYVVDPLVSLSRSAGQVSWHADIGMWSQLCHQVGMSDIGFASDFWLPSAFGIRPQRAFGIDAGMRFFPQSPTFDVSAAVFAKRVLHSPQYVGALFDLIDSDYNPYRAVMEASGFNVGGNLLVSFRFHDISGWIGYGIDFSPRRFSGDRRWFSSSDESLHSFKLAPQWRFSDRWLVSAYFVMSSGRSYTPVKRVYVIGGNVISEYGDFNSARLPLYHKLDLSLTYDLPRMKVGGRSIRSFVNVSVLNAYGHQNTEMQYFTYNEHNNTLSLKRVASLYRFLPSLSFSAEF